MKSSNKTTEIKDLRKAYKTILLIALLSTTLTYVSSSIHANDNETEHAVFYNEPKITAYYNTSYVSDDMEINEKTSIPLVLFPFLVNKTIEYEINSAPKSYSFSYSYFGDYNSSPSSENNYSTYFYKMTTIHYNKNNKSDFYIVYLYDSQQDLYDYYMFRGEGIQELLKNNLSALNQSVLKEYLFYLFRPSLLPTFVFSNYTNKLPIVLPRDEKYYTDLYIQQIGFKQLINESSQENANITVLENNYYWNKTNLDLVIPVNTSPPKEVLSSYDLSLTIKLHNDRTLKLNFSTSYIVRIDKVIAYILNCSSKLSIYLYNENNEEEFYINEGYSIVSESYGYFKKFSAETSNNNMDLLGPNYVSTLFTIVILMGVLIFLGKRKHVKNY